MTRNTAPAPADLFAAARRCIEATDPDDKMAATQRAAEAWQAGELALGEGEPAAMGEPGRPARPRLVPPKGLPKRSMHTREGFAAFLHAVAHIEFNAINLAWDAVYRFRGLPADYYDDWVRVAAEEAYHFGLVRDRLRELNYDYGDFDAHNGLWDLARRTAHDHLARMAVIPRGMEARGLDVTPGLIERVRAVGDEATVAILEIILRDEIGHVEVGTRWFRHLCEERGADAETVFAQMTADYLGRSRGGPFNTEARRQAGFTDNEMAYLNGLEGSVQ